ncbi:pirin family protein [Massilia sp. KIM]|uniref:pirin family protein n=1 Tax=Massilia sp. KIM TaxID=1955422 RepID=UPI00098F2AF0|nr:pirin family protein [Massilia sp. KIM]
METLSATDRTTRPLLGALRPEWQRMSEGLSIAKIHPASLSWELDPVLQIDWFRMSRRFFPPHPHAGFSAVTLMLPNSAGGFINRDSLGDASAIPPGAMHWTEAARGMMHEEVPQIEGLECHGLQIFVNLPARFKLAAPAVYHVEREQLQPVVLGGAKVYCYVGDFAGLRRGAVAPRTTVALWTIALEAHAPLALPLPPDWNLSLLVTEGAIVVDGQTYPEGSVLGFGHGDLVRIEPGATPAGAVVLAGPALREPLAVSGPS